MTEQKTSVTYTHKSETPVSDVLKTQNKNPPHNSKDLLNWTIKTIARSPKETLISELSVICLCALVLSFTLWISWDHYIENPMDSSYQVITLTGTAIYIIALGVRQKTIYNYTLKTDGATVEYYLHYPDFASSFFKGIAIFVMLVFGFVAILTGSLLFLVGPVAMAFIAAIKLLNWENPVHHRQTAPWQLHEFVTVDHKRLMVIIHCDDITTGFAARFPSKALMDKYLAFLREVLPANVEYIEKATHWYQG
ncbi:permease [Pseudomonas syringae]|uniref:permease n=1 Tax=Pseudomonas syringae TaxID=317 RepID=UPI001F442B2D|nr:permease [Pseudomonas syringae]